MKKLCAVLLCVCLLCFAALPVQASSGWIPRTLEDALTVYNRPDLGYSTQVVVGTLGKNLDFPQTMHQVRAFAIDRCVYGNVEDEMALYIPIADHTGGDYHRMAVDRTYLLITITYPADYAFLDGKKRDVFYIAGFQNNCAFWFEDGTLHGYSPEIMDEILADDPTIDNMDELVHYFEKRIDALQREGKLPPDPVDWPGLLCAAGGLMLLGGLTVVLVYRRRRG